MTPLWTWGGIFFGHQDGDNLWTHSGKHVGKFHGEEVYGPNGEYLGELRNDNRLIVHKGKKHYRKSGFSPYANRVGFVPYVNYVGYVMHVGCEDFLAPAEF
jgi:hypothetical protein